MADNDEDTPNSPLKEAAIQAHEMYITFKDAGFSRGESLELVAKMVVAGIQTLGDSDE